MTSIDFLLHLFDGWKGFSITAASSVLLAIFSASSVSIPVSALVSCLSFSLGCTVDEWEVIGVVVGIVVAIISLFLQIINVFFIRRR